MKSIIFLLIASAITTININFLKAQTVSSQTITQNRNRVQGIALNKASVQQRHKQNPWLDLMTWDATTNMDLINQPLLMMAGSKADTKYMSDEAFSKATNAKSKELFLIDGATHIQTYWRPEYVSQAVNKLTDFFASNLK